VRLHSITIYAETIEHLSPLELQLMVALFLAFHDARLGYGGFDDDGDLYVEPSYAPLIVPTYIPDQRYMI
jgi:hypothetical protein